MSEPAPFQKQQYELAAHIRDPQRNPAPPGIEDRRLGIYRDLFFSNLSSLMARTFPVLKKIVSDTKWRNLVRGFMTEYESHTPLFLELPREFLTYLTDVRATERDDPPFLTELAHYEWVELALSIAPDQATSDDVNPFGNLLDEQPVVSELVWVLAYQFPVHRIDVSFQPEEPGTEPVYLAVYRKRDDEVGFLELNAVTARVLELIRDNDISASGRQLLQQIATEIKHPDPAVVIGGGEDILNQLRALDIIPGTRKIP